MRRGELRVAGRLTGRVIYAGELRKGTGHAMAYDPNFLREAFRSRAKANSSTAYHLISGLENSVGLDPTDAKQPPMLVHQYRNLGVRESFSSGYAVTNDLATRSGCVSSSVFEAEFTRRHS